MNRIIITAAVVLGLTLGMISFSTLTDLTQDAVACGDKDKETSKDKDKGQTS